MAYPMNPTPSRTNPAVLCQSVPVCGEAVRQAYQNYQAPYRLCLMGALAAISSTVQSLVNVVMPYGAVVPVSLYAAGIADSGERKSALERRFMKGVRDSDDSQESNYRSELVEFKVANIAHRAERRRLEKALVKAGVDAETREIIKEELRELLSREPRPPQRAKMVYEDISPMAMLNALNETGVGTLVSSEGGVIVDGRAFDAVPHLNSIWSDDPVNVARVGKPDLNIRDARLTISIMLQPSIFEPQTGKKGEKVRGSGHWARYLIFCPESTQGSRFSVSQGNSWEHIQAFDARIREIQERARLARIVGEYEREQIRFSEAAAAAWYGLYDQIEAGMGPSGRYARASDHASKLAENVARVAALLHYFERKEGDISEQTFQVAADICADCSDDFLRLFVQPPEEVLYAIALNETIDRIRGRGIRFVRKTYLQQRRPSRKQIGTLFELALDILLQEGIVRGYVDSTGSQCLDLCPMVGWPYPYLPDGLK